MPTPGWVRSYAELRGVPAAQKLLLKDSEKRLARIRATNHLYYPASFGFRDYVLLQRALIKAKRERLTREEALRRAQEKARRLQGSIRQKLQRIFEGDRFDRKVSEALQVGAEVGETLGLLTEGMGPEAGVATAVVGYVVGIFVGFWPHEKQALLDDWRAIFAALTPEERWLVMPGFRALSNYACAQVKVPQQQPWRIGNDGGLLGHNLGEGIDVTVLFLLEVCNEYDWVPSSDDPRVYAYALALLSSYHEDEKKFRDMRDVFGKAKAAKPNAVVAALLTGSPDKTCGEARAEARKLGIDDYGVSILTDEMVDKLSRMPSYADSGSR